MPSVTAVRTHASAHLLMVDDNGLGLQARKAVLEEVGYRVSSVATPEEALDRLSQDKFDIVITDYRLESSLTGVDLIGLMREQGFATKVILLSGFVVALGLHERNTGADLVIEKSANEMSHLTRGIRNLLRSATLRKPPGKQGRGPGKSKRAGAGE